MVFNPTLQGGVRFDQPVQQGPSGVEVLGNVLEGLNVPSFVSNALNPETREPTQDERFNRLVRTAEQEMGVSAANMTPSQLRRAASMDPSLGEDFISYVEAMGGQGLTEQRSTRDDWLEYQQTEQYIADYNAGTALYDSEEEIERYVREQRIRRANTVVEVERLDQRAAMMEDATAISDGVWRAIRPEQSQNVNLFAAALAQAAPRIAAEGVMLSELGRDGQALAQMIGRDMMITRDNIREQIAGFRSVYESSVLRQYNGALENGELTAPNADYWNGVFSNLEEVATRIQTDRDPSVLLSRFQSGEQLRIINELSPYMRNTLAISELYGDNPQVMLRILNDPDYRENLDAGIGAMLSAGVPLTSAEIGEMSPQQVRDTREAALQALSIASSTGQVDERTAEHLGVFLQTLPTVHESQNGILEAESYSEILNPRVWDAVMAGEQGSAVRAQTANLFQLDIQREFDNLSSMADSGGFRVRLQNGQLSVFSTNPNNSSPNRTLQETVARINTKLGTLNSSSEGLNTLLGTESLDEFFGLFEEDLQSRMEPDDDLQVADRVINSLAYTESRGDFTESNNEEGSGGRGHFGRLQFSRARMQEAINAGVMPEGTTPEEFMANPMLQQRVEQWHIQDHMNSIRSAGYDDLIGQSIRGVPITMEGMLAVAHLGGFGGLRSFIESGGQDNRSDVYGATLMRYFTEHGSGAMEPIQLAAPSGAREVQPGVFINPGIAVNGRFDASLTMENASEYTLPTAGDTMQNRTLPAFQRLQQYFGGAVAINDAIAQAGTGRENNRRPSDSSRGSAHFHGEALDLDISRMSNEERLRLVRAAHAAGFTGFGFGDGILHVDIGPARSWAYSNETFAGLPLSEVQAMVSSGEFSSDIQISDAGTVAPQDRAVDSMMASATPDYDPGEGAPSNFTVYDQQNQTQQTTEAPEPEEVSVTTPEQGGSAREGIRDIIERTSLPISEEIRSLIEGMTNSPADSDRLLDELQRELVRMRERERVEEGALNSRLSQTPPDVASQSMMLGVRQQARGNANTTTARFGDPEVRRGTPSRLTPQSRSRNP